MKNKGYTLVELLAIISILGVVMILMMPTMLSALRNSKLLIKKYDLEGVEDAGKMYVADRDNGIKSYIYNGDNDIIIRDKTIKPGTHLSGYDFKVYLIDNGPITVDMKTLVEGGYYDKDCKYAENPDEKDINCHLPKDCTLLVGINAKYTSDGYYVTEEYTAKIGDNCE